jgi:phage gpG-like protein
MVEIAVKGKGELIEAVSGIGEDLGNLKGPFTDLAREVLTPMLAARFVNQGPGWAPLNPVYAAWKAKAFPGRGILERSGKLRTAFSGGVGWEIVVTNTSLQIDPTRTPYWRFHQYGTRRMPARPIISFDENQKMLMIGYLQQKIAGFGRARGFSVKDA